MKRKKIVHHSDSAVLLTDLQRLSLVRKVQSCRIGNHVYLHLWCEAPVVKAPVGDEPGRAKHTVVVRPYWFNLN